MLPNAVVPGTRLVDRYLLEEIVGEAAGTAYWRAHDELLDRPVGMCLLSQEGHERAEHILRAARLASAVSDPRFLRILDANESDGGVYVVNEWVKASSLADLLADGPLPPAEARALAGELAQALAAAHREGLSHLCLQPENVLRTSHGQIKISGLGVDAAVRSLTADGPDDAARRDAEGCAAVLYAALTGRWPISTASRLPPAPTENGVVCSPRQVRAGIPHDLDDIAGRALGSQLRGSAQAVQTPQELADLLAAGQPTGRPLHMTPPDQTQSLRTGIAGAPGKTGYGAPYDDDSRARHGVATRLAWVSVVLVLLLGLGLTGYQLVTGAFDVPDRGDDAARSADDKQGKSSLEALKVADITTLDPPPGGNGEENSDRAGRAIDGDPDTQWNTKTYRDPFGPNGLKEGVGLLLDLGQPRSVHSVEVTLGDGGTDLELRAAERRSADVADYRVIARATDQPARADLRPADPVRARYLLLWLTSLPAVDASDYRGAVAEVVVRGST